MNLVSDPVTINIEVTHMSQEHTRTVSECMKGIPVHCEGRTVRSKQLTTFQVVGGQCRRGRARSAM